MRPPPARVVPSKAAGGADGVLQVSSDGGVTWRQVSGSAGLDWQSVAISGDGRQVTAVAKGQGIYTFGVIASAAQATRVALEAEAASARLVGVPDVTIAADPVSEGDDFPDRPPPAASG